MSFDDKPYASVFSLSTIISFLGLGTLIISSLMTLCFQIAIEMKLIMSIISFLVLMISIICYYRLIISIFRINENKFDSKIGILIIISTVFEIGFPTITLGILNLFISSPRYNTNINISVIGYTIGTMFSLSIYYFIIFRLDYFINNINKEKE